MKNIIWQMGDGRLVYFSYASNDVDTKALAAEIKAAGGVDADWTAVAFNQPLPAEPQEAWSLVNGELVATAADVAAFKASQLLKPN